MRKQKDRFGSPESFELKNRIDIRIYVIESE